MSKFFVTSETRIIEVTQDNHPPQFVVSQGGEPGRPGPAGTSTVVMTQVQYDALTPDPNTYYLIIGSGLIVRIYHGSTITWDLDDDTPPPQWAC